jgi:hypothetical protein
LREYCPKLSEVDGQILASRVCCSHVEANELSTAVANLPDLSAASSELQQAMGTDGRAGGRSVLGGLLGVFGRRSAPFSAAQPIVDDLASTDETA